MALSPGSRLGPYEIVSALGAGGMGEVYRAHDARLGRDVAIKVLPAAFASDADRLRRFDQEARAAAALTHPNVLAVFDVHTTGEVPYLVSELLEGESLREALLRGPLPPRTAVALAVQIARGLAAAHQKGIVHRDLKPANVFVTADGRAKILDFGLARVADVRDADAVMTTLPAAPATHPGAVLGTVGYMSPEQARGEPADARSDIFALGVVCYEMLAGRRTFAGGSEIEVLSAILRDDPPELPADLVPAPLERIVRRCLEKPPAQRFQSASDVAFALEALSGTGAGAPSAATAAAPPPVPRRWTPARVPLALGALVVGALAGGLAMWRLAPPPAPGPVTYDAKTFDRLMVTNARFMPDGQTIVYSAATRGYAPELFVVNPTAEAPQRLGVTDAHLLSVSSKGELALIVNASHEQQRLYSGTFARMSLGSAPRAVRQDVREAAFGPDGEALAIVQVLGNGRDRLEYPIGTPLHEVSGYLSDPRVSPDGTCVAFVAHPWLNDDRGTIMVVSRGGAATALTEELWSVEGLAWSPDGARVVFSGNRSGGSLMEPMSAPADGSRPAHTVLGVPGRLIVHDIAPDGRWLAVREDLTFGVRARVPGSDEERELSWLGSSGARSLSADGRTLLMVDVGPRGGRDYGVVLRATDGASDGVRLGTGSAQRLSPDGAWAAAVIADPAEIVLYPTGPGDAIRLGKGRFATIDSVDWFPDARRLLVCGSMSGQAPRCFTQPVDGGAPAPVTAEGVTAALAPDGTTVILTAADGAAAVSALGRTEARPIAALTRADRVVGWSRDSRAVFVQRGSGVPAAIERVDLATGARTQVAALRPQGLGSVASLLVADWVDEGRWYAYNYTMVPSVLFVLGGIPQ
ncbi:MAG: protein kinase [Vicinamibacterales bacterium]